MRIKKIKVINETKLRIDYDNKNSVGDIDKFSLISSEPAAPSFYAAIDSLSPFAHEMCELSASDKDLISAFAVSLSYNGEAETLGAVITARKTLKNSNTKLILNTPHKLEDSLDDKQTLSEDCTTAINTVLSEAEKYVTGERAQMDLFAGQETA